MATPDLMFTVGADYSAIKEGYSKIEALEGKIRKLGNSPIDLTVKSNLENEIAHIQSSMDVLVRGVARSVNGIGGLFSKASEGSSEAMNRLRNEIPAITSNAENMGRAFSEVLTSIKGNIDQLESKIAETQETMRSLSGMQGSGDSFVLGSAIDKKADELSSLIRQRDALITKEEEYQSLLVRTQNTINATNNVLQRTEDAYSQTSGAALESMTSVKTNLQEILEAFRNGKVGVDELKSSLANTGDMEAWNVKVKELEKAYDDARIKAEGYSELLAEMSKDDPSYDVVQKSKEEADRQMETFDNILGAMEARISVIQKLRDDIEENITNATKTQEESQAKPLSPNMQWVKDADLSTNESSLAVIKEGERKIIDLQNRIEELKENGGGVTERFISWLGVIQNDNTELERTKDEIEAIQSKVEEAKNALNYQELVKKDVVSLSGNGNGVDVLSKNNQGVEIPVYFKTEQAYKDFLALQTRIIEIKDAIANYQGDDKGLEQLKTALDSVTNQYLQMQNIAHSAANNVSEKTITLTRNLYETNAAIENQRQNLERLVQKEKEYAEALAEAKKEEDPTKIELTSNAYNQVNIALERTKMNLDDLKTKQEELRSELIQASTLMVKMFGGGDLDNFKERLSSMPLVMREIVSGAQELEVGIREKMQNIADKVSNAKDAFTVAGGGVKGFNAALKTLAANPVGAVITAVAMAVKLLQTWFEKSEKGQKTFAYLSGYIGTMLKKVMDIGLALMDGLFDMFASPTKSGKRFASVLLDAIGGALKAMVSPTVAVIKLWSTLFDSSLSWAEKGQKAVEIAKEFGKTWVDAFNSTKNVINSAGEAFNKGFGKGSAYDKKKIQGLYSVSQWHEDSKKNARADMDERTETQHETHSMTVQQYDENGKPVDKGGVTVNDMRARMLKNQIDMRDTSKTAAERKKAIEEYEKDAKRIISIQKVFAQERADRARLRVETTTSSIEDLTALDRAEGQVAAIDNQFLQQQRAMTRIKNAVKNQEKSEAKKASNKARTEAKKASNKARTEAEKASNKARTEAKSAIDIRALEDKQAYELAKLVRNNAVMVEQNRINGMKDGAAKTLAQLKLNHQKELDAITDYEYQLKQKKLAEAKALYYKKNPKGVFKATEKDITLNEEERSSINNKTVSANQKYSEGIKKLWDAYRMPREIKAEEEETQKANFKALQNYINEARERNTLSEDEINNLQKRLDYKKQIYEIDSRINDISDIPEEQRSWEQKQNIVELEGKREMLLLQQEENDLLARKAELLDKIANGYRGDDVKDELATVENDLEAMYGRMAKVTENNAKKAMDIDFQKLTEDPDYILAYEHLDKVSTKTLKRLIKNFEDAKKAAARFNKPQDLKAYTDAIDQMKDAVAKRNPFKAFFGSMKAYKKAKEELKEKEEELTEAKGIQARVENGEQVWMGKTRYNEQTKQIEKVYETKASAQARVDEKQKAYDNAQDKVAKEAENASKAAQESIAMLAEAFQKLGDVIGGTAGEITSAIGGMMSNLANNWSTMKGGGFQGWAAAIQVGISAIMTGVQLMDKMETKNEKAARKQHKINDLADSVRNYRNAIREAMQAEKDWFSNDGFRKLKGDLADQVDAVDDYNNKITETQVAYQDAASGISKTWHVIKSGIGGAVGGALIGSSIVPGYGTIIGAAVGAVAGTAIGIAEQAAVNALTESEEGKVKAIDNLRVQTQHRTYFRGEKTQDLQGWINDNFGMEAKRLGIDSLDLFDKDNKLNIELAKAVLDSDATLVGETEETLLELIEYQEKVNEYYDNLKEYVSGLYEPLLDNMTDAIWDWYKEGKDALDAFYDYAASTFENIGKQITKEMIQTAVFDDLQDQLEDVTNAYVRGDITDEDYASQIADSLGTASAKYEEILPRLQNFIQYYDDALSAQGVNMGESSSEASATVNSAMSITEDTANELVGIMTAQRIAMESELLQSMQQTATLQDIYALLNTGIGQPTTEQTATESEDTQSKMVAVEGLDVLDDTLKQTLDEAIRNEADASTEEGIMNTALSDLLSVMSTPLTPTVDMTDGFSKALSDMDTLMSTPLIPKESENDGIRGTLGEIQQTLAESYIALVGIRTNTETVVRPIINMSSDISDMKNKIMSL